MNWLKILSIGCDSFSYESLYFGVSNLVDKLDGWVNCTKQLANQLSI